MLASLLPGLRDVRIPLTVGYLWLLIAWILFGHYFPDRPSEGSSGPIARLYELSGFLGDAAAIAAISFAAYVLGALLTVPLEGRVGRRLLRVRSLILIFRWNAFTALRSFSPEDVNAAMRDVPDQADYQDYLRRVREGLVGFAQQAEKRSGAAPLLPRQIDAAVAATPEDLRPRLLSAERGKEIYGEYDRLAAEAAFRINIALPLVALGSVVVGSVWHEGLSTLEALGLTALVALVTLLVATLLICQGANRLNASVVTMQRAAMIGVFVHPLQELSDSVEETLKY